MRHAEEPSAVHKWMIGLAVIFVAGCASTEVDTVKEYAGKEIFPRPTRVLIHDFVVSPDDVSLNTGPFARLARALEDAPENEEETKVGRATAQALSEALVKEMKDLGFNAERTDVAGLPGDRVLSIQGVFLSIDEGNRARRMVIGFGLGETSVITRVNVSLGTTAGPLEVAQFKTDAKSSKKPGMGPMVGVGAAATSAATAAAASGAVGTASELNQDVEGNAARTAKEIAKKLSRFFAKQGWITKEMIIE